MFMRDKGRAGTMDATLNFGPHHFTPEFSYNSEHDYLSYGAALTYALDLNGKNTTLSLGWSHDWDTILPNEATYGMPLDQVRRKDTDDLFVGVNQLLGTKTVLAVNFTYRNAHGYLDDPYCGVLFDSFLNAVDPAFLDWNNLPLYQEPHPGHRESYFGYASLTQFVTPLHGGAEGSYRFSYDSYGIDAHTVELSWHQKIGRLIMVSPLFRYYRSSAADFYGTHFAGDPTGFDPTNPPPTHWSSDYRLSALETFSYGTSASERVARWCSLDASFKRYEMLGLDYVTSASTYPEANVFTVGARLWF